MVSARRPAPEVDESRRKFLTVATSATAAVGAVITVIPFAESWEPSERARALGAPVEVDISKLEVGQMITTVWRKQVIYIVRRAPPLVDKLARNDGELKDQGLEELDPAGLRAKRDALATGRCAGADRYLHPSRMPAEDRSSTPAIQSSARLAGRLPLSLPRFALRSGRPRFQRLAGADEPVRAAV